MMHAIEFSRTFTLSRLINEANYCIVEASAKECASLAQRFELLSLANFKTNFWIDLGEEPGTYHLKGHLEASIVQACVFTLQDVESQVQSDFDVVLLPQTHKVFRDEQAMDPDLDYEIIHNDEADFGEIAAQYLSLALDPYPHVAGSMPDQPLLSENQPIERPNPFNVLASLKR